ncbi:tumor necrosis factor receptor superfamily member 9b isoform 1-T1 [Clarias gariepinus]|uniref:tumor necrosis factor receptor superfamily member 9b isoform X2 n=1 Tax=Clarias gariepinus TaxID=13013 RepID=UPI00234C2AC9|nr:tumor necrosis factor receptor superfamily member 9b isoform X2 [Clarias gariepinus]
MMWLVRTLVLSLSLSLGYSVEPGCAEWNLHPSNANWVCCERCKPGNHLVSACGSEVKTLCVPCVNGTFTTSYRAEACSRCTQCIGPQRVKHPCTASTDTVCECVQGFVCGNRVCTFCVQQCGKGQEPTDDRRCRACPAGTFNDQIHHKCINWSSSCPSPDQHIVASGTASSDITCSLSPLNPTSPTPNEKDSGMILVIAIICACLIISSALPLCAAMYFKKEKTVKIPPGPVETPAGRRLVPEPEQCSFCFPQEERGSHSSLLTENKPFELVV